MWFFRKGYGPGFRYHFRMFVWRLLFGKNHTLLFDFIDQQTDELRMSVNAAEDEISKQRDKIEDIEPRLDDLDREEWDSRIDDLETKVRDIENDLDNVTKQVNTINVQT